jgi:hypothetical protein
MLRQRGDVVAPGGPQALQIGARAGVPRFGQGLRPLFLQRPADELGVFGDALQGAAVVERLQGGLVGQFGLQPVQEIGGGAGGLA